MFQQPVRESSSESKCLKMTTAQVVETSVTVNNNSPVQDYVHPNDLTQPTFDMALMLCARFLLADLPKLINQGESQYNSKDVKLFKYSNREFKMSLWRQQ